MRSCEWYITVISRRTQLNCSQIYEEQASLVVGVNRLLVGTRATHYEGVEVELPASQSTDVEDVHKR